MPNITPIVVSLQTYAVARALSEKLWKPLEKIPGAKMTTVWHELKRKNIVVQKGQRSNSLYKLRVPIDALVINGKDKPQKTVAIEAVKEPAAVPMKRPTVHLVSDFVAAVDRLSREIAKTGADALNDRIGYIKIELAETTDLDVEHKLIRELSKLHEERRSIATSALLKAMNEIAALEQFRMIDWRKIVSFDSKDYSL